MNDLWDTLPHQGRDDKLGLIYQTSRTNMVAVNTSVGQTERKNIPEIVTQGGTWGPMLCSNSVDTVGKFSQENGQSFKYKNISRVIPLAMVDDLLSIANCGFEAIEMNTTINTIIELKKLKFHTPQPNKKSKCHYLHIGKQNKVCPGMKVHGYQAEKVTEAVYLGDCIRDDGKNTSTITNRVNKGIGTVTHIMDILKTISFGVKYFEIAVTLREAMLINGMLTNSEIWYGLNQSDINQLEEVDKLLLRRVFETSSSSCIESFYLELGIIPIHIIIMARRFKYLHFMEISSKR